MLLLRRPSKIKPQSKTKDVAVVISILVGKKLCVSTKLKVKPRKLIEIINMNLHNFRKRGMCKIFNNHFMNLIPRAVFSKQNLNRPTTIGAKREFFSLSHSCFSVSLSQLHFCASTNKVSVSAFIVPAYYISQITRLMGLNKMIVHA